VFLWEGPENGCNMFLVNVKHYLPDNTQIFCLLPGGSGFPDLHIEDNEEATNRT